MRKLRVGIIGAGMAFEQLHYPAFQELKDHYEIKAICDINRGKAAEWARRLGLSDADVYTDYMAMVTRDDIDVIDIMVPIELNYKVTEAVAQAISGTKKGIICEKPLAPTLEQAKAHAELPKKYNVPIMIAENYRFNEEVNIIRDLVRTKRVGDIYYFMQNRVACFPCEMGKPNKFPNSPWRQHPDYPGGVIMDTGVHDMAALRHIFGPIDKLQAFGVPLHNGEYAPYASVSVNFRFKSGVVGQFSFFTAGKEMQRPLVGLRIFGTTGMIYLEERDCGFINVAHNDGKSELIPYRPQRGYYNELLNFHKAMTGQEAIAVPPELEYGDTKTILDILRSAKEGSLVSVDAEWDFIPADDAARRAQEQPGRPMM
ncbi:oxidoreductase, n-terminal:oxidoreductase, c-terminal, putative [Heliomicrobium modesticaldum Ice1]|uniref:Oxidoreductase, n-terminal:oxidoreductase, c-terminal, putative n=1 Tax=Heliobacterium modesticaldum (strain ATCC 51547 / Ice1) TaxID=498761 RepID=B0TFP1_HELMI|nr:Gfo/Idh/MocA family oxidoreductase [Heliomicrobium modesticaldum]ABZ84471.1 oxidoreductase, n-terminal:oxidoreductase, c-terminal, putative [Heliomicrobium modesticaldum Ice1]